MRIVWKSYEYIFNKKCINCKRIMNKLWTILCMNCKCNMYSLWMKYEQIVNKIIFILFFRTYIEARYIALRYIMSSWTIASVKYFYLTYYTASLRQVFLLDKISYNLSCKNAEKTTYVNISPLFPYPSLVGGILHYKTFVRLRNQGHVFHSHVTLKI